MNKAILIIFPVNISIAMSILEKIDHVRMGPGAHPI